VRREDAPNGTVAKSCRSRVVLAAVAADGVLGATA
jgi:hypothetical protein